MCMRVGQDRRFVTWCRSQSAWPIISYQNSCWEFHDSRRVIATFGGFKLRRCEYALKPSWYKLVERRIVDIAITKLSLRDDITDFFNVAHKSSADAGDIPHYTNFNSSFLVHVVLQAIALDCLLKHRLSCYCYCWWWWWSILTKLGMYWQSLVNPSNIIFTKNKINGCEFVTYGRTGMTKLTHVFVAVRTGHAANCLNLCQSPRSERDWLVWTLTSRTARLNDMQRSAMSGTVIWDKQKRGTMRHWNGFPGNLAECKEIASSLG
jgi:hypothetical protein